MALRSRGPYAAILPSDGSSEDMRWSTCMPDASSFAGTGPPPMPQAFDVAAGRGPAPSCWNPSYKEIKQWYSQYSSWAGKGKPFTYTNCESRLCICYLSAFISLPFAIRSRPS